MNSINMQKLNPVRQAFTMLHVQLLVVCRAQYVADNKHHTSCSGMPHGYRFFCLLQGNRGTQPEIFFMKPGEPWVSSLWRPVAILCFFFCNVAPSYRAGASRKFVGFWVRSFKFCNRFSPVLIQYS